MTDLERRIKKIEERIGSTAERPSSEEYIRQWLNASPEEHQTMKAPMPGPNTQFIQCDEGEAMIMPAIVGCSEFRVIIDDIPREEACYESQEAN